MTLKTYPAPPVHTVTLVSDEVTCIGTPEGNPDFYVVEVAYGPDESILCTKSLKRWFGEQRDVLYSAERFAATILEVVRASASPRWAQVTVTQKPRGGISIVAVAGWRL